MSWIFRKLDTVAGAVIGGAGGMALSQAQAFTNAYLQRLGGHLDEAQRTVERVREGKLLTTISESARAEALHELTARVAELQAAWNAITGADPLLRPMVLAWRVEPEIARRTATEFVPALPLDTAALIYTIGGVVLALLLYELLKAPGVFVAARLRRRRQRRAAAHARAKPEHRLRPARREPHV